MGTEDALQANTVTGQTPEVTALLIEVRGLLEKGFDESEVRDLCFHLGLDPDDIRGQTRNEKVRELTLFAWRRGLMKALLEHVAEERPNLAWPELKGDLLLASLSPAEKKAAMPVKTLAEPGPLLPSSHVPRRNARFVGREAPLMKIAKAFRGGAKKDNRVVIISGIAGIGKTQLAVEFAHRYGRYFDGGVYWLNFGEEGNPESDVVKCGRNMVLHPEFGKLELADQLALVQRAWQAATPRLLVFDDCRTEALLEKWLPNFGGSQVLVTSWKSNWIVKAKKVPIRELTAPESERLLADLVPHLGEDTAAELAEELGYFPLALWMAGSFLRTHAEFVGAREYLRELRELGPGRYQLAVGRNFILSYRRLKDDRRDQLAISLMQRAACFAPDEPIPWRLLAKTMGDDEHGPPQLPAPVDVAQALRRLEELGLMRLTSGGNPLLHRLVANSVMHVAEEEQTAAAARDSVERAIALEAQRVNDEDLPSTLVLWQGHLRYIAENAERKSSKNAGKLLNELGQHLHELGNFEQARLACERAAAVDELVFGPEHQKVARDLNSLGLVLLDQGQYAEARQTLERALAINRRVYGNNHHAVAEDTNALGLVYRISGEYSAAKDAFEQALAIDEAVYGPEHPDVAVRVNNVGMVLRELGDNGAAKSAFERALAIDEAVYGKDHPRVALRINNLGSVHWNLGEYAAAKDAFQRALDADEKVYGPNHPKIAIRLNNLGRTYHQLGDYASAREAYGRGLAINERVYGADHPYVAILVNNLGSTLMALGEHPAAEEAFERALQIDETVFGPDHPSVAKTLKNLGQLHQELGEYPAARDNFQRALDISADVLGNDHPDTLEVMKRIQALDASQP